MKGQINIRASEQLQKQLDALTQKLGTSITETISIALDRMYQQENSIMGTRPNSEIFAAHNYTVSETRQSRFDKDANITVETHMICPRCKNKLPIMEHAAPPIKCENCALNLELHGNTLTVWE